MARASSHGISDAHTWRQLCGRQRLAASSSSARRDILADLLFVYLTRLAASIVAHYIACEHQSAARALAIMAQNKISSRNIAETRRAGMKQCASSFPNNPNMAYARLFKRTETALASRGSRNPGATFPKRRLVGGRRGRRRHYYIVADWRERA